MSHAEKALKRFHIYNPPQLSIPTGNDLAGNALEKNNIYNPPPLNSTSNATQALQDHNIAPISNK